MECKKSNKASTARGNTEPLKGMESRKDRTLLRRNKRREVGSYTNKNILRPHAQRSSSWAWRRSWDTRRHGPGAGSFRRQCAFCSHPPSLPISLSLPFVHMIPISLSSACSYILFLCLMLHFLFLIFCFHFKSAVYSGGKKSNISPTCFPQRDLEPFRQVSPKPKTRDFRF